MRRALLFAPLALLCACAQPSNMVSDPNRPVSSDDPAPPSRPDGPTAACPILESSEWAAWVNAMPGPDRPTLIVTGKVTVPTGGWRLTLEAGPIQESYPAVQRVELRATPPSGAATQALVTHEVRGEFGYNQEIGAVAVRCGSRALATISSIEKAY